MIHVTWNIFSWRNRPVYWMPVFSGFTRSLRSWKVLISNLNFLWIPNFQSIMKTLLFIVELLKAKFDSKNSWNQKTELNLKFCQTLWSDAFKSGKVLASNPHGGHSAALISSDSQNYIFKDSTQGSKIKSKSFFSNKILFIGKIIEVPISDSDYTHMFNGWWIEFKNVS